ncbi:MAG: SPASM domain-containing protein, partial [Candidatus Omnitrophica bacterium]|nr:SPASM domain-containing protein [Candidatus Omnitrophota bacterium]
TAHTAKEGFLFDKIMTNAVWYRDKPHLATSLTRLNKAGYDGEICVSVDAFHRQDLKKTARFIETAQAIWRRPDVISIACVRGAHENSTRNKLENLARLLKGRLVGFETNHPNIKSKLTFIKIFNIDLSPIGRASKLKDPWDGQWFKEDYCGGPGNVFFVAPSGDVKPCCGYANDLAVFTIGNIRKDSPRQILKNFRKNRLLCAIFDSGLAGIRERLEKMGVVFPGKTGSHCYFCHHILTRVPKRTLLKCLDRSISS